MKHLHAHMPVHPTAGIRAIGFRTDGTPIWGIAGGADDDGGAGGDGGEGGDGDKGGKSGGSDGDDAKNKGKDDSKDGGGSDGDGDDDGSDKGFPANTAVAEMTDAQQAAYWTFQAEKWKRTARENEARAKKLHGADFDELAAKAAKYEKLRKEQMSEQEKAVEAAKAEASTQTRREMGGQLVQAEVRARAAGRLGDEQLTTLLEGLDTSRFLTKDAEVDTDKVIQFIDGIAPATEDEGDDGPSGKGRRKADLGQGRRNSTTKPSVSTGRDAYERRHGKKKTTDA